MKIFISGYYGFGNVGDEAVLQVIVQGVRKRDPNIEISVLSAFPSLTRETYHVNAIFRYCWPKIIKALWSSDVFVSGGGTLFQNSTSNRSLFYYLGLVLLAMLMRKKTVVFAQGFGPLKGIFSRAFLRFVLSRVNLITLRDQDSFEQVKKMGIRNQSLYVTADPTAILKIPSGDEGKRVLKLEGIAKTDRPLLGIAVRSLPKAKKELFAALAKTVDWLSKEYNYLPVFILFQAPRDMGGASKISELMQEKSNLIFRVCKPNEMLGLVSQLDLLIGMRLHSLIFAAMNCIPMLGLSYDPKVKAFMKTIEQPCINLDEDFTFEKLKNQLIKVVADKDKIKSSLEVKNIKLKKDAELNFKLLYENC